MKWFPGSINDAVTAVKQREAIFVVFVRGNDNQSIESSGVLDSEEISTRLDRDDVVAITVDNDTESFTFFTQIYGKIVVPSLYFIGTNGVPLEILSGAVNPSILSSKIDSILAKATKKETFSSSASSSSNLINAERDATSTIELEKTGASTSTVEVAGPSRENSKSSEDETAKSNERRIDDEILAKAKNLILLQKNRNMELEREEEKKREIERRQLGKDLQAAKKKQHEAEMKLAYEERIREKAADAEAREKVCRQIAQDKLERKQRDLALQQLASQQQNQQESPERSFTMDTTSNDATIARIQFRPPTGNPHIGKFDPSSTLGSLRSYVAANIELPFSKFSMSTTFPRRDLTAEDDEKSLTELELVPTAVILILPIKNLTNVVKSSDDVGFVSRFIWALFAPIVTVYNYVIGYFNGAPTNRPERRRSDGNLATGGNDQNSERYARILGQSSGLIGRNLLGGPTTTIRSRGNIHRLHSGGDDNDENNTWNGNSTQQM